MASMHKAPEHKACPFCGALHPLKLSATEYRCARCGEDWQVRTDIREPKRPRWSRSEQRWALALEQREQMHAQALRELGAEHPTTQELKRALDEARARIQERRYGKRKR